MQINRLLNITQAINSNVSSKGLYEMYRSFLSWEMGAGTLVLLVKKQNKWKCRAFFGIEKSVSEMVATAELEQFNHLQNLDYTESHPFFDHFDVVIPVLHQGTPIAYAFVGGLKKDKEFYNNVQLVTTITNIIAVAIENKRLFKQQLEQERLERDLELARQMQHLLIPSDLPNNNDYELASIYKPQQSVGGDFFDYQAFEDDTLVFCIADMVGKGIPAALLMANFQANFRGYLGRRSPMDEFIQNLNQSIFRITKGDKHLTFFIGQYNRKTKRLQYCNAGHNPPVIFSNKKTDTLQKGCTILGSFPTIPKIEIGEINITDPTTIVMYTDGLTDIQDEAGNYFDEQALADFVKSNNKRSAGALNDDLLAYIEKFKGRQNYPDDFTVLTCSVFV